MRKGRVGREWSSFDGSMPCEGGLNEMMTMTVTIGEL